MKIATLIKSKIPVLLILLLSMCKDANLVSPKKSTSLVGRIAESKSFERTLFHTKKFYRASILEMLYTRSANELNQIIEKKLEILSKGDKLSEADVLKVFNYPNSQLFVRDATLLSISFDNFFTEFSELKKLSQQDLRLILSQSVNKFKENFWAKNGKRDAAAIGGRVQSCSSDNTVCVNAYMADFYTGTALCAIVGIGGALLGIGFANPLIVVGALAFGEGCLIAVNLMASKHAAICAGNFAACMAANSDGSTTNWYYFVPYNHPKVIYYDLQYYFEGSYWLEIPMPPPTDENGCFHNAAGDLICY